MVTPLLLFGLFLLGLVFAVILQWLFLRHTLLHEKKKDYWERKLTSYRRFYCQTHLLIEMLKSETEARSMSWPSMTSSLIAATDAAFFDFQHKARTAKMKEVALALMRTAEAGQIDHKNLDLLSKEIESIYFGFLTEEGLVSRRSVEVSDDLQSEQTGASPKKQEDDFGTVVTGLVLGCFLSGCLYLLIFSILCSVSAMRVGANPIDVLLFFHLPSQFGGEYWSPIFPFWSDLAARPTLYACGALYGAIGIVFALAVPFLRIQGVVALAVVSNGLFIGYYLTIYLAGPVLRLIDVSELTHTTIYLKLGYLFLVYFIVETAKDAVNYEGLLNRNYKRLLDGIYALVATFVVFRGFGAEAKAILTGPLFLIVSFATIFLSALTVGRLSYAFISLDMDDAALERLLAAPISRRERIKAFIGYIWKTAKNYQGENVPECTCQFSVMKLIYGRNSTTLITEWSISFFLLCSLFPILAFLVWNWILGGF